MAAISTSRANPITSASQYGLAQAVASGTARKRSRMTRAVAQEMIDKTPAKLRDKFAKELAAKRANPKRQPKSVGGYPIVKREADAYAVYDVDEGKIIAYAPGQPWSLSKTKALRERGSGHKVVYVGFPQTDNPSKLWKRLKRLVGRGSTPWIILDHASTEAQAQAIAGKLEGKGVRHIKVQKSEKKNGYDVLVLREGVRAMARREEEDKRVHHTAGSAGRGSETFKGYKIQSTEDGYKVTALDPDSTFDSVKDAKAFITVMKAGGRMRNPGSGSKGYDVAIGARKKHFATHAEAYRHGTAQAHSGVHSGFSIQDVATGEKQSYGRSGAENPLSFHDKLLHALTEYDRQESKKKFYNMYALPQYLAALHRADQQLTDGKPVRAALVGQFTGRLLDRLLKAAGEPRSTRDEQRGRYVADNRKKGRRNPTIYEALRTRLGRTPTNAELKADVERIKREALEELASKGKLPHQRKRGKGANSKKYLAGRAKRKANPEDRYEVRFIRPDQSAELVNLYHLARVPLSGAGKDTKYYRMLWASKEFHKAHPEISETAAYKDLDGLLSDWFTGAASPRRKKNPEADAIAMRESFTGLPSNKSIVIEDETHVHSHLAALGELIELRITTVKGKVYVLDFASEANPKKRNTHTVLRKVKGWVDRRGKTLSGTVKSFADAWINPRQMKSNIVLLCSNEKGTQLFIEGGDQTTDLAKLGLSELAKKESATIGSVSNVTYHATKKFDDKEEEYDYVHKFSEDSGGLRPTLRYDTVNEHLYLDGGVYHIPRPLIGTSQGITD